MSAFCLGILQYGLKSSWLYGVAIETLRSVGVVLMKMNTQSLLLFYSAHVRLVWLIESARIFTQIRYEE